MNHLQVIRMVLKQYALSLYSYSTMYVMLPDSAYLSLHYTRKVTFYEIISSCGYSYLSRCCKSSLWGGSQGRSTLYGMRYLAPTLQAERNGNVYFPYGKFAILNTVQYKCYFELYWWNTPQQRHMYWNELCLTNQISITPVYFSKKIFSVEKPWHIHLNFTEIHPSTCL